MLHTIWRLSELDSLGYDIWKLISTRMLSECKLRASGDYESACSMYFV